MYLPNETTTLWAATWTWPKILEFYFLNELWQSYYHALKPRNLKFHKDLSNIL